MLRKVNRLKSLRLNSATSVSTSFFTLKTAGNNLDLNRFAFVVSKKIDKRATQRNLLRRRLSSCVEEIFDRIKVGNDFVIYPKPEAALVKREEVLKELESQFIGQGLLK